ncbi:MAG TPA: aspartate dehydrogenase domain-containing protein [Alphaproteobacteria bacterium]|nr:aspartate dehydrogenase domain-containing protein [Alphaproteobacteria bacterium]
MNSRQIRVGLAGFGNVGQAVAARLDAGVIPEMRLAAITSGDLDKARGNAAGLRAAPPVVPLAALAESCDVVVECATAGTFAGIARVVLGAGKTLIAVSAGGVPNCPELAQLAREHGARVILASGALPGLDAMRSAAEGKITSVHLRTQLRPDSLAHEETVRARGFDLSTPPREPVKVFEGTGGETAAAFPRHFNVAITLSLATIGFDRTRIEVWADPTVPGTVHTVTVESEDVGLTLISRNRPSPANPRTSRIVAHNVIATLRSLAAPIQFGS